MIRHAGRALALFAVGALFAGGAWAQSNRPVTLVQSVTDPYTVAAELLGSADGTVVQLGSAAVTPATGTATRPAVRLTLTNGNVFDDQGDDDATNDTNTPVVASIVPGNTAELTFTLSGAVFAQNVGGSTLDLREVAATSNAVVNRLSAEVINGGAAGDSSVTFLIESTSDTAIATGQRISFWVPDLRVTPTTIGATATTPPMPIPGVAIVATLAEKRAVRGEAAGAVPFPPVVGAVDTLMPPANNVTKRQVVGLANVIGISMGDSDLNVAEVALNNRKVFATSNETHTPRGATSATRALGLGTLAVTINAMSGTNMIYTLDPSDPAVEDAGTDDADLDNSLAGNVDVVVKGTFNSGDMVLYGAERTEAKIADGMAAVSVPITGQNSTTPFIYVPGGVDDLRPGTITAVAMRNFSRAGNASGKPAMSMGTISYFGVGVEAYAHGVVRGGGTDASYVRVRCADARGADGCVVFADCHDQAGDNYFEEAGMVAEGATAVVNSDMIAAALNGGWDSGRGACDLLSNGELEVQHMVRSGHVLINNSAVVGRSLSENRLASIDEALANICSSVTGHSGRDAHLGDAANPETDDNDATNDVSMIAATMCKNINAVDVADTVDTNGDADGF